MRIIFSKTIAKIVFCKLYNSSLLKPPTTVTYYAFKSRLINDLCQVVVFTLLHYSLATIGTVTW